MAAASFSWIMFPAKAKMAQELLEGYNNEFWLLTWPSNSPDLNPIEYLRDVLDKQVRLMQAPPPNLQDLKDLLLLLTQICRLHHMQASDLTL